MSGPDTDMPRECVEGWAEVRLMRQEIQSLADQINVLNRKLSGNGAPGIIGRVGKLEDRQGGFLWVSKVLAASVLGALVVGLLAFIRASG